MRKIYVLFIIPFLCVNWCIAQSSLDVNYKKPQVNLPDVSSLMKFIDYPADLHRGLINIDIPLYTIQEGDLILPISISYHASGLRVREGSGRIAQGWTLNAEPSVSRNIEGSPDETGYLRTTIPNNLKNYELEERILTGIYDVSPDRVYYKLLAKSGKFYYKRDLYIGNSMAEIVVHPYEPIKIISSSPNSGFNIIDDKGVNYKFIGGYGKVNNINTQWLASEVTSASGKYNINFSYEPIKEKFRYSLNCNPYYIAIEEQKGYNSYIQNHSMFQCGDVKFPVLTSYGSGNHDQPSTYNIIPDPNHEGCIEYKYGICYYNGVLDYDLRYGNYNCAFDYPTSSSPKISYQLLKTITTSAVEVRFFYGAVTVNDDDEEPLQKIEVKDKQKNEIIRTIYFTQSTYNSSTTLRKLDEVRIVGKSAKEIEIYTFDYSNNDNVPRGNTASCDHWGYSKGKYDAYGTGVPRQKVEIPRYTSNSPQVLIMEIGDASKETLGSSPGMLKSITYPTGRKSIFYFEPHQYIHDQYITEPERRNAGGMRIAKIEEYDPCSDTKITKLYKYGKYEDGIGNVRRQPSLNDYTYEYEILNGTSYWYLTKVRMFFPEPLAPMTYDGGCSTKYNYVSEYMIGENEQGSIVNNGKTIYKFKFDDPGPGYIEGTTINYDYDAEWATGELLEKTDYKYDNNNGQIYPVLRNTYQYGNFKSNQIPLKKVFKRFQIRFYDSYLPESHFLDNYYQVEGIYPYNYMSYNINTGCKRILSEISESFDQRGNLTVRETKNYTYENSILHSYPIKIEYNSGNDVFKTEEFTYPQNILYPTTAENALIHNNQLNVLLKKKTSLGSKKWINKSTYNVVNGMPLPVLIWSGEENKEEERVKVLKYDSYGNPVHIQMDGINSVYLWGYNGKCLIAEIANATYDQVKTIISELTLNSISTRSIPLDSEWTLINNLRINPGMVNSQITTYKYKPLVGVIKMTDPSGKTIYYEYDTFGRLISTKDLEGNIIQEYDYHYKNQ